LIRGKAGQVITRSPQSAASFFSSVALCRLTPTPESRLATFMRRGTLWSIAQKTNNLERALSNLLERDRLFIILQEMIAEVGVAAIKERSGRSSCDATRSSGRTSTAMVIQSRSRFGALSARRPLLYSVIMLCRPWRKGEVLGVAAKPSGVRGSADPHSGTRAHV
jgi:hypothetical protein